MGQCAADVQRVFDQLEIYNRLRVKMSGRRFEKSIQNVATDLLKDVFRKRVKSHA